jgi:hypothetical protein
MVAYSRDCLVEELPSGSALLVPKDENAWACPRN